jgi:splicing factor 3B subunit 4
MTTRPQDDRNQEATVYLVRFNGLTLVCGVLTYFQGNLDERVTDAIVWELMLQAGPVGQYLSMSFYCLLMNSGYQ